MTPGAGEEVDRAQVSERACHRRGREMLGQERGRGRQRGSGALDEGARPTMWCADEVARPTMAWGCVDAGAARARRRQ